MRMLSSVFLVSLFFIASVNASERRILFLADSHGLGPFGQILESDLSVNAENEIETYAIGGSAPNWFFYGTLSACGYAGHTNHDKPVLSRVCKKMHAPLLKNILQKNQLVLVELGANLLVDPLGWGYVKTSVDKMVRAIQASGASCIWIGPPHMRRFSAVLLDRFYDVANGVMAGDARFAPCRMIDSRKISSYPATGGDGVHFTFPAGVPLAKAWAHAVATEVGKLMVDGAQ